MNDLLLVGVAIGMCLMYMLDRLAFPELAKWWVSSHRDDWE